MTKLLTTVEVDCEDLSATLELIETILALEVTEEESVLEEVKKTPNGLVLKELLKGLKYVFLGQNETKLMIIYSQLDSDIEVKLLGVLKKNSEAFAWSSDDIK